MIGYNYLCIIIDMLINNSNFNRKLLACLMALEILRKHCGRYILNR